MAMTTCRLCYSDLELYRRYEEPDQYQSLIKTHGFRHWYRCTGCRLFINVTDESDKERQKIYMKYRDPNIRDYSIEEEFKRINKIPASENRLRAIWLFSNIMDEIPETVLDIGSGLGVFPYLLKYRWIRQVYCVEPEPNSARFIHEKLDMPCHCGFYKKGIYPKVDLITLVHMLEHIFDPITFLLDLLHDLKDNGLLFIEIPDSVEFDYLPKEHDEFNSLHLYFYNVENLNRLLWLAGFEPYKIENVFYKDRKLSRIRALCRPLHSANKKRRDA